MHPPDRSQERDPRTSPAPNPYEGSPGPDAPRRSPGPNAYQPSPGPNPYATAPGPGSTQERWADGPGLIESALRYWWLILAAVAVGAVLGFVGASMQPDRFEASSVLRLAEQESVGVFTDRSRVNDETFIARQVDLIGSSAVLDRAAGELGMSARGLRREIEVVGDAELLLIRVYAVAGDATSAAARANAVGRAYQDVREERTRADAEKVISELRTAEEALQARISELESQLARAPAGQAGATSPEAVLIGARIQSLVNQLIEVETRIQEVAIDAEVAGSGVRVFEEAEPPASRSAPQPLRTAILTAFLAGALAGAFAYWRTGRPTKVRSSRDPGTVLGVPLIGQAPALRRARPGHLAEDLAIDQAAEEAYQFCLTSLEYELARIGGSSVILTSAGPMQGKTMTALQLAIAASTGGREIVVVDGDLRARSLSALLDAEKLPGLAELASGEHLVDSCRHERVVPPSGARVSLLPVGDAPEGGLSPFLRSRSFAQAMWRLRRLADLTIVDSAPLLAVADTALLAEHVDGVVLVVHEKTRIRDLERLRDRLAFVSTPVLGYVFIGSRGAKDAAPYAYYAEQSRRRTEASAPAARSGEREDAADPLPSAGGHADASPGGAGPAGDRLGDQRPGDVPSRGRRSH